MLSKGLDKRLYLTNMATTLSLSAASQREAGQAMAVATLNNIEPNHTHNALSTPS
tara:strand:- start:4942 stop:5106 length:165 start_codon:yes stop_codon:yes gene_type:complete